MTFGKELARLRQEHPLFANHYLAYQELKNAVEEGDVAKLMGLLRQELDKINDIVDVEMVALRGGLQVRCRKLAESSSDAVDKESLDNLAEAINRLHVFVEANYLGFQKIMKRCSERQDTASCSWFSARIEAAAFRRYSFDDLLVPLGQLHAALRQRAGLNELAVRGMASQALSQVGEGHSQAFFLQGKDIMRVKLALLRTLRPSGTMLKAKTTQGTRDTSRMVSDLSRPFVHVYLEGASGNQYSERYKRRVGGFGSSGGSSGVLLRCRIAAPPVAEGATTEDWTDPEHEVEIDVEDESGGVSVTRLPQRVMTALLEGQVDAKHKSHAALAAAEAIKRDGLRPAVSASFVRSSFTADGRDGGNGPELVSIDEAIFFRDEAALSDAKAWCFVASKTGASSVASPRPVEFPGAVLRVWLPPQASADLVGLSGLGAFDLQQVPSFSEALHGTALVHRELATPLPPWIPDDSLMPPQRQSTLLIPRASPTTQLGGTSAAEGTGKASEGRKNLATAQASRSFRRAFSCWCRGGAREVRDVRLKVDCKTPLAIERTLLRWMRSTVLLASLSSYLVSAANPTMQLNGLLLGLVAILFVALPAHSYWSRSVELANPKSEQPKVDRFLPTAMAWSFSIILLATLVVSITSD